MKTALSIPDPLFEAGEALAQELGVSRSELYARALDRYVAAHNREDITAKLNTVHKTSEGLELPFRQAQSVLLAAEEW